MGLFEKTKKPEKNKTAAFYVDIEDITKEEFNRLKRWVKENISSTERYTPKWEEADFPSIGGALSAVLINIGSPPNNIRKLRFSFKHEEDAMAFKLIL